jgi:hypothetical protein
MVMMKALRFVLCAAFLMALSTAAVTVLSNAASEQGSSATSASAPSDAQKSFEQLKNLAGTWEGHVKTTPPMPEMDGGAIQVTLRVTSRGNALVHEMKEAGVIDDPTKYDHPVTMFYLDGDRLLLTHYCDAGNRPRMTARTSSDGKTVEFDFVDVAGPTDHGHMQHAVFTIIDGNHHIEDWTYLMPGDKPVRARMDLTRAQ